MKKLVILLTVFSLFIGCNNESANSIKIGVVVPLSGNAGSLGDYTKKGLELAVEEQNNNGGLLGKKIILDIQDSKAEPKEGINIIKKMLSSDFKPFMVYSIMSGVTMAIKPETEKNNIILMSAVGTDQFLDSSKLCFRNFVSATTIGEELIKFLSDSLKVKNLSIFYSNNEFGKSVKNAVSSNAKNKNVNVVVEEPYEEKALDYKSIITSKVDKNTECIYVAGVGKGLGTMIKQIRESGYTGKIIGDPLIPFPDVVNAAGDALKGVEYMDFSFDIESIEPQNKKFVDSFKSKFNTNPQNFSVITYEGMKILFDVVNKAQTIEPNKIAENLNKVSGYNGTFGKASVINRNFYYAFKMKKVQ